MTVYLIDCVDSSRLMYHVKACTCFIGVKDDGSAADNCSCKSCRAPVKMSPPTKPTPNLLQAGCPSCRLNLCMCMYINVDYCWHWTGLMISLSVCLSVCLSICLSITLAVCVCSCVYEHFCKIWGQIWFWFSGSILVDLPGTNRLEYWALVPEIAPHSCEEQIDAQRSIIYWGSRESCFESSAVCPCAYCQKFARAVFCLQ